MKLTFLGTGTSGGVPSLGCTCDVCRSTDPHDKRLRTSALLEDQDTRVLIDCGPDFRQQLMPFDFKPLTGVLLTHIHYDHVGGIDDLRPFCVFGPIDIFADHATANALHHTMPYCFTEQLYPGAPLLNLHEIELGRPFQVGCLDITPIEVMHGKLPITAYKIGRLTYITDMKTIAPDQLRLLEGTETLVVNALRWEITHHSHMLVHDAIDFARMVGAKETYLVHVTHEIGFHHASDSLLPAGIHLAYDGLQIEV